MNIIQIMPAVTPKKAVIYDPLENKLVIEVADIIGLIEMPAPEDESMVAIIPMYMCTDESGFYQLPQLFPTFLGLIDKDEVVSLADYSEQIVAIKADYEKAINNLEEIEVERKGNVSHIKRIVRQKKPPTETK